MAAISGPAEARPLRDGLATRGLPAELATEIVEEAVGSLLPFAGDRGLRPLVVEALARRIPVAPLSRGGRVVTFVGPGGAGKTRCVAKLAAAHARTGMQPVAAVALRPPDQGAELARLLAPHGVAMHAVEDAGEAADRIARLRGQALVLLDTPGVSPRSEAELRALAAELRRIGPDEVHLTVPATMGADAARELVDGAAPLGVRALALTHTDETGQLGTGVGLAMSTGLPLSWLARGEAVEGGLRPVAAGELADALVP